MLVCLLCLVAVDHLHWSTWCHWNHQGYCHGQCQYQHLWGWDHQLNQKQLQDCQNFWCQLVEQGQSGGSVQKVVGIVKKAIYVLFVVTLISPPKSSISTPVSSTRELKMLYADSSELPNRSLFWSQIILSLCPRASIYWTNKGSTGHAIKIIHLMIQLLFNWELSRSSGITHRDKTNCWCHARSVTFGRIWYFVGFKLEFTMFHYIKCGNIQDGVRQI